MTNNTQEKPTGCYTEAGGAADTPTDVPEDECGLPQPRHRSVVAGIYCTKNVIYRACIRMADPITQTREVIPRSLDKFTVPWAISYARPRRTVDRKRLRKRMSRYLNWFRVDRVVVCDARVRVSAARLIGARDDELRDINQSVLDATAHLSCIFYPRLDLEGLCHRRQWHAEPSLMPAVAAEAVFTMRGNEWLYLAEWAGLRKDTCPPATRHMPMKTPVPAAPWKAPWYMKEGVEYA